jgi:hypothetical protein
MIIPGHAKANAPANPRNNAGSRQLTANANLTRLAVAMIRTAIYSSLSIAPQPAGHRVEDKNNLISRRWAACWC